MKEIATKYNHLEIEKDKYDNWLKNKYFEAGDKSKDPFCIVIPPPNVTGKLHLGHAYDTTLQDVIIRYKRMQGFDTLWLPGMDHAAIATEAKVVAKLKESGINKYELGREKFLDFEEIKQNYKTASSKIGLDVSKWQGDIDFTKLKEAGVEFVMIRVGRTKGRKGKYLIDEKFVQNIKGANKAKIPVGVYFYSYASSSKEAIADAKWVLKQIKKYQVDLPIAFDWEEWSSFNEYNLSFFGLTSMAEDFIKTVEKAGYQGMLYSSKTYLENIWLETNSIIWLAHYTSKTDYAKDFKMWQVCSNGKVEGINGAVDVDIMY